MARCRLRNELKPRLDHREWCMLKMRHGLGDGRKNTLEEVGNAFGVSGISTPAWCQARPSLQPPAGATDPSDCMPLPLLLLLTGVGQPRPQDSAEGAALCAG